ncbi:MAG: hypothetical protein ABWY35_09855 [Pseudorhodoplanes sp.]|jgi:hypothetical protein
MAKRYNILTRCLAALALLFVYVASTSAILVGGTTTSAQARGGRGGGRGGFRGGGRGFYRGGGRGFYGGRGRGFYGGPVYVAPGPRCWWNAYGARVCRW